MDRGDAPAYVEHASCVAGDTRYLHGRKLDGVPREHFSTPPEPGMHDLL